MAFVVIVVVGAIVYAYTMDLPEIICSLGTVPAAETETTCP